MKLYISLLLVGCVLLSSCATTGFNRPDFNIPDSFRGQAGVEAISDSLTIQPHDFFTNELLLEWIDTAFLKNSDLLIAAKNIELVESVMRTVRLNYFPDISAQINGNYTHASVNSSPSPIASGTSENYTVSLGLDWEIDIQGKIRKEKQEVLAHYLQQEEVRKTIQMRLTTDVAKTYYNLLMLDRQLEIANRSKELSDSTLHIMELQYKVGDANLLGIRQVKAQLEQNKQLISQIEQSIASQENALCLLCGNFAQHIKRNWADGEELVAVPQGGYQATILMNRPDVRAAEHALTVANARVGIQKRAMYPSLKISASGGLNSLLASNWFNIPASLFGTVAGSITQPVFNRRKLKEQYEQAKIEREKEVIHFRQSVLEAFSQISDALKNREEIERQYVFSKNREEMLRLGLQSSNILFRAGSITYLDVISVQTNYLQAQLETADLYIRKINSTIDLYYRLGGGWQ
jgi:NodT family efflux transporter outer membrane factor (OMF) lipoprotein